MSTDKSPHIDSHKSIIKSTSILSGGTLLSRILGFIRDIMIAKFLGTGIKADAFFVALKIPNLFRDLVGEGATNSAVVPVFSEYKEKHAKEQLGQFMSVVLFLALMILSVITILGIVWAPYIVRLIAPGFIAEPDKLQLTIHLTKIMFPYLIFIGLTAYTMAILYTFRFFVAPAFSPCLLNIAMVAGIVIAHYWSVDTVYALAISVLIGGLLQLSVQIPPLTKTGIKFKLPRTLLHPGAIKVGKLLIPRLFGAGVYQLTVFIDTFCASLSSIVGPGGISAIYYSNRIIQFPMGIFSVALASAVLPSMAKFAINNDIEKFKKTLIFAIENIFFIMFPTSVMLMLLANPIIRLLFERGEFDAYSTSITSLALLCYAIGLFSFGGIKIMVTAFHSLQDTKTPVKVAAACLILNGTLNFLLMWPFKVGGIALASSIAASLDFLILFYIMEKRLGPLNSGLAKFVFKILISTALTGAVVYLGWNFLKMENEIIKLTVVGLLGFSVYGVSCYALKVEQALKIYRWINPNFPLQNPG